MTTIPNPPERAATHTTIIPPENELLAPASKAIARTFGRANTRYKPGQSGNPGGVTRTVYQARLLFRIRAPELAQQLIDLALTAVDERVKSVCLIACLGNAGIKPQDYDPNADKPDGPTINVSSLSADERAILRQLLEKAATLPTANQDDPEQIGHSQRQSYGEMRATGSGALEQDARGISDVASE